MRRREFLVTGGMFGAALMGAYFLALRPEPAASASPAPADLPPDVARLLEGLKPSAREAYAFALARPDVLQWIPCYCGCEAGGHSANLECFVRALPGGGITLEPHGAT